MKDRWPEVLNSIEKRVSQKNFTTWFQPLKFLESDGDTVFLGVRDRRPLFRPVESVLASIREVMEYGCSHFYICFDPEPSGAYYRELFKQIRKEKLELRMAFGCWNLPGRQFVDDFKDTFIDGSFEISDTS